MSFVCTRMSSVYHSYVLVCHPFVTRMYLYVIRISLVCTRMSSICHSYVLVCLSVCHSYVLIGHPYVTRMYCYVIRMPFVCIRMSFVCHSYVLACHSYVTRMWFYQEPILDVKSRRRKNIPQPRKRRIDV